MGARAPWHGSSKRNTVQVTDLGVAHARIRLMAFDGPRASQADAKTTLTYTTANDDGAGRLLDPRQFERREGNQPFHVRYSCRLNVSSQC